jgi:hypothetical protein
MQRRWRSQSDPLNLVRVRNCRCYHRCPEIGPWSCRRSEQEEDVRTPMRSVELRELMLITIAVRPLVDLGGGRRYVAFDGGTFEGRDGMSGTVLEGGADWQTVRPDGILDIDAHYTLQTEANEAIEVVSQGVRKASASVTARLAQGDQVGPDEYYFRTLVRLSTAAPRLSRLNDLIAVSTGERERNTVRIHVHEVL